jgi:archaellum component FlaC
VLKAAYFKNVKDELANNLARKTALVEKAEALKDSTEWKKTTDALVALQKEWKTIGTVAKKHSDAVWHRFQAACDYFFEQKKAATSGVRQTEQANLQAKRDLIKELDSITEETPKADAIALISDLQERWKSIGHVPFREKDKVYEAFRTRINEVRTKFDLSDRRGRLERFENAINEAGDDENKLLRERERQMRLLENRRAELRTYENNLGFLSAKSKSGSTLVRDFERKIERLKADITSLEEKINLIDSKLS